MSSNFQSYNLNARTNQESPHKLLKFGEQENTLNTFEKRPQPNLQSEYSQTLDKMMTNFSCQIAQSESLNSMSVQGVDGSQKKKGSLYYLFNILLIQVRRNPWNLKGLSGQVKDLMIQEKESTYKHIANTLVLKLQNENINLPNDEKNRENQNLKRRVYDSINVMVSLGFLNKRGKTISLGTQIDSQAQLKDEIQYIDLHLDDEVIAMRCKMGIKRKFFREQTNKVKCLQRIIQRNKNLNTQDSEQVFQFPLILAQTKLQASKHPCLLNMSLQQDELSVASKNQIFIYGDLDIISKLKNLDIQPIHDFLSQKGI